MNNSFITNINKRKAGIIACLFSFIIFSNVPVFGQQWVFNSETQKAYDLALNLQTEEARQLIPSPKTAQEYYVISLADAMELLITEDAEKYPEYEDRFQKLLDQKVKSSSQDYQFLMAEIHLQWAFVYLKFGHEFDAGTHLRESFLIADRCRTKNPAYKAIQKTTGLLNIIIGSVPEKYNWVLSLLGMDGSVPQGLLELDSLRQSKEPLALEADLLYSLIHGFVFQKPDVAFRELKNILNQKPDNRLVLFLGAAMAIKNSQSEEALSLLENLKQKNEGLPLYYSDYMLGEVLLHKGDYQPAISAYRSFVNHYKGQNYLKDAYYKMALCYRLNGNTNDAFSLFKEAKKQGKEESEADKSAARNLASEELPQIALTKARYYTDGGYYDKARVLLQAISDKDLPTKRDQVEYYYRKARLEHKTNQLENAKSFYTKTIELAGDENWYFAPNSCLQSGYIYLSENKQAEAKRFFQKALTYKKHEYKNSIDSKAKSALAQLKK